MKLKQFLFWSKKVYYPDLVVKAISLWSILVFSALLFNFNELFGSESLLLRSNLLRLDLSYSFFLIDSQSDTQTYGAIFTLILISLYHLIKPPNVWLLLIQFVLLSNLEIFIHATKSSGWHIVHNFYLYYFIGYFLCWINNNKYSLETFLVIISRWQTILIYTMAGLSKFKGEEWFFGDALRYALLNPKYSNFIFLYEQIPSLMLQIGSGFTLLFQMTFFLSIASQKLNRAYLLGGLFLHLGIFINFGLTTFLVGMVLSLWSFWLRDDIPLYQIRITKKNQVPSN